MHLYIAKNQIWFMIKCFEIGLKLIYLWLNNSKRIQWFYIVNRLFVLIYKHEFKYLMNATRKNEKKKLIRVIIIIIKILVFIILYTSFKREIKSHFFPALL